MKYRQEWKFICTAPELELIRARLEPLMKQDDHLAGRQAYNIRSIYLDDDENAYFWDNEAGINERMKFRLRIYDGSDQIIKAEIKYKLNNLTRKEAAAISTQMCHRIMDGEAPDLMELGDQAAKNLLILRMHDRMLRPKVIVEYDRSAFVSRSGNVRITFDQNIRTSAHVSRFFEKDLFAVPVLPQGQHVLEVKFDEMLPDYIAQALEIGSLRQAPFSKYYLSRLKLKEYGYDI